MQGAFEAVSEGKPQDANVLHALAPDATTHASLAAAAGIVPTLLAHRHPAARRPGRLLAAG